MRKCLAAFLLFSAPLCAQQVRGSRHMLGVAEPLTAPSDGPARDIAQTYIRGAVAAELSLSDADLSGMYVAKEYTTAHNGVTHLVYRQQFAGIDVYNAEWVVNVDSSGRILNTGGTLYPAPSPDAALPPISSGIEAARAALEDINPKLARNFLPLLKEPPRRNSIRLAGIDSPQDIEGQLVWYGDQRGVRPAWLFFVTDDDGVSNYASIVDDATQAVVAKQPLTYFDSAAKGLVFERESPQPNPTPGVRLTSAPPLVDRTLQSFGGDPKASPHGWVIRNQTVGNNAVVGENLLGITFLPNPTTTTAPDGDFSFPLQLGPGMPSPLNFSDAANTNLFYWMNRAHDLHYQYGFDEAAGNFQTDNYGRGGSGGDPIYAYTHFGAASPGFAQIENAFFTSRGVDDGSPSMVAMFLSQSNNFDFFTDGSFDSQVMVHEYTHGVSTRLVRQGYSTFQGAAMGEAWSDFYAVEYTTPAGAPPDGIYPTGQYFDQSWGVGDVRSRPYSTNMDLNPLTYADLGRVIAFPEVHADGEIWFEALWEMRANLVQQFGDAEGRRRVRMLVMDGMKLSVPAPSMVDMRDAILLADRVDFNGASQSQIWAAFAKRGLGALAYSSGGSTVHVVPSFDLPSATGQLKFYDDPVVIGEAVRVILQDSSYTQPSVTVQLTSSSGDVENLVLRKNGSTYIGAIGTSASPGPQFNSVLSLATGDFVSVYYTHNGPPAAKQISTTIGTTLPYTQVSLLRPPASGATERPLNTFGTFTRVDLPFEFPFFSNKYAAAFVHRNGLISFGLPVGTSCTDSGTLSHFNGITPLWLNLITTGTAQPKENVYMSQDSASVTFHWIAESRTPFAGRPGHPVDFSATLYNDGRIQFNYAPDSNTNLNFDASYYGCGIGPIAGISNGHDAFTQAVLFDTSTPETVSIRYDPPFGYSSLPVAKIESPAAGQHFQGIVQASGVAYDPQAFVTRIDVYIDGVARARTSQTMNRPDVCSGQSINGCPRVGFSLPLDVNALNLAPGEHTLSLRVSNSRGGFTDVDPVSFTIDAGQSRLPKGSIEAPAAGDSISGRNTFKGWAFIEDLRVVSVDLLIDGVTYGPTVYGLPRPDVCAAQGTKSPNCPGVGFQLDFFTKDAFPPLIDGPHTIKIRVRDETGRYTVLDDSAVTFNVNNGAAAPIVGALLTPKSNDTLSGTVTLNGYAYSKGHRIIGAIVIVDGFSYGAARINQPAPDICAQLTGVDACPNIGFTFDLNTNRLQNGPHILGIELVNDNSDFTVIPNLVNGGINVFVQNP